MKSFKSFKIFKQELAERILDKKVKLVKQGDIVAAVKFAKITAKKLSKAKQGDAIDLAVKNFGVDRKALELLLKESSVDLEDEIINIFKKNNNIISTKDIDKKILANKKLVKLAGDASELEDFFNGLVGDLIIEKGKKFIYMG